MLRDCELCKKFVLADDGRPMLDITKKPIPQSPKHSCNGCPKEDFKNGFEYDNERVFKMYTLCRAFGCLPYPGSLIKQPAELMDLFDELLFLERQIENEKAMRNLTAFSGLFRPKI